MLPILGNDSPLTLMGMPGSSSREEHLNRDNQKHRHHGYEAGHGRVALVPEVWKTWIGHRNERCGKEVHERSRNEDTGTKVFREEQEIMWNWETRKAPGNDRERACWRELVERPGRK